MPTPVEVPGLPFPLDRSSDEVRWNVEHESAAVSATAAPQSDVFIDPGTGRQTLNAATLLGVSPAGDFTFSARVSVDFQATFDAGVLLLWLDERNWAKLCFEFSPDAVPMVVSVVSRGVADDANAFVVGSRSVWLRVSRIGRAFAFHASVDGTRWSLVRHFALDGDAAVVRPGFEVQSPTGDGCAVRFDEIRFVQKSLAGLRDGS